MFTFFLSFLSCECGTTPFVLQIESLDARRFEPCTAPGNELFSSCQHHIEIAKQQIIRRRAFFLNHEGTFGNREGMIT